MLFPLPKWLETMPPGEARTRAEHRFVLRLCCLYSHPRGDIESLARLIGVNPNTLKTQIQSNRGLASDETRIGIQRLLGPAFVPPRISEANASGSQSPVQRMRG